MIGGTNIALHNGRLIGCGRSSKKFPARNDFGLALHAFTSWRSDTLGVSFEKTGKNYGS